MWAGVCSGLKQVTGRKAAVYGDSDSFPFRSLQPTQVLSHCGVSIAPVPLPSPPIPGYKPNQWDRCEVGRERENLAGANR